MTELCTHVVMWAIRVIFEENFQDIFRTMRTVSTCLFIISLIIKFSKIAS